MKILAFLAAFLAATASHASTLRVFQSTNPTSSDLFWNLTEIAGFRKEFCTGVAGLVLVSFRADVKARTTSTGIYPPMGFGFRVRHRTAGTLAGLNSATWHPIPNAYSAGNISSLDDHYGEAVIPSVPYEIGAGCHRFEVWGTSHTSNAVGFDGAAELNGNAGTDYNNLTLVFLEGGAVE